MAWTGDGHDLRNCREELLAAICPYTAVAVHIDSRKHKIGTYVPVPARNMIGEVVVRFASEAKAREKQSDDLDQIWQQHERPRTLLDQEVRARCKSMPNLLKSNESLSAFRLGSASPYP
jgi:hypothetical protein